MSLRLVLAMPAASSGREGEAVPRSGAVDPSPPAVAIVPVEAPVWPQAACFKCGAHNKWSKLKSDKHCLHWQDHITDEEGRWEWRYTCHACIMKSEGCTEQQAHAIIMECRDNPRWARKRNLVYREAMQNRQQEFPGMSRSGLRTLVRKDVVELLAPLAEFVARKLVQLTARARQIEAYDQLLSEPI